MKSPATIHVVVSFTATDDEITAKHTGVIAWSRTLNPDTGDYSDPVEMIRLGTIPDWFDETGDAGG